MNCRSLILLALVAACQAAIAPAGEYESAGEGTNFTEEELRLVKQLEDEELSKEIENLVGNLDDEQLEKLEAILAKDLDEASEMDMLMAELKELGMDQEDIEDLLELAGMMTKFLQKVPEVEEAVLTDSSSYNLEDNVKLYLLGLPNNLGPLGFFALHSVLQDGDEDIVDVKIGEFEPDTTVESVGDVITRKRRAKEAAAAAPRAEVKVEAPKAENKEPEDLVAKILERRRRAILEN